MSSRLISVVEISKAMPVRLCFSASASPSIATARARSSLPPAERLGVHAEGAGQQLGRGVGEQLDRLGRDRLGVLGGVGQQQRRRDRGQDLAAVGRRGIGGHGGEVGAEHRDGLGHPAGRDEGLRAPAHQRVQVDVVGHLGQPVEQAPRLEELHRGLVGTTDGEGLVAGLDAGHGRREPVAGAAGVQGELGGRPDRPDPTGAPRMKAVCRRARSPGSRSS